MATGTGDVVEVVLHGEFNSQDDVINVFHFQPQGLVSLSDANVIDDLLELFEALLGILDNITTIKVIWDRFRARNITDSFIIGDGVFEDPIPGLASGDACPPGVSPVVTFPTTIPRVRGRKFFAPTNTDLISASGFYETTVITAITSAMGLLTTQYDATNASWRYGIYRPVQNAFVVPSSAVFVNIPGYQRRRKQGVGA